MNRCRCAELLYCMITTHFDESFDENLTFLSIHISQVHTQHWHWHVQGSRLRAIELSNYERREQKRKQKKKTTRQELHSTVKEKLFICSYLSKIAKRSRQARTKQKHLICKPKHAFDNYSQCQLFLSDFHFRSLLHDGSGGNGAGL